MIVKRFKYLILVFITIILGLISRKVDFIPLSVGDVLYGVMMYFIIRFLSGNKFNYKDIATATIICISIEVSQLYQAEWINSIRSTLLGRLILGRGFLWSDIMSYIIGILLIGVLDKFLICKQGN